MAQEVLFFGEGIELSIDLGADSLIATLTLSQDGIYISRNLQGEELLSFYRATRHLIKRHNPTYLNSRPPEETRRSDSVQRLGIDLLINLKRVIIQSLNSSEFEDGLADWVLTHGPTDFLIKLKGADIGRATSRLPVIAEAFIGLPQREIDLFTIERIQNATGDFMEALGFELETQDEPVFGSFFQRLKYLLNGEVKEEVGEIYSKGKIALETQFVTVPSAEATSKLAAAAASLITALNGIDEAAIRLGAILVVKVSRDGVPLILAETVSPELALLLDKNPQLLKNPSVVFDLISTVRIPDKTIEGSESIGVIE